MLTPTTLLRMSIALLGVALVVLLGGCRKPRTSFAPETPRTPPPVTTTSQPDAVPSTQAAVTTVHDYLAALQGGKFTNAYELLSRDSKNSHTISDFEQQGKQGMPSFDLKSAKATITGDTAVVTLAFLEEPNSHGFHLIREDAAWRIVYRGGAPGMPYPE